MGSNDFGGKIIKKQIANIITGLRIVLSFIMIPIDTFSAFFYILYTFNGISDIADGIVARKFHLESKRGAMLDSISDVIFFIVVLYKLVPILIEKVNIDIWILIIIVGIVRLFAYVIGAIKYHRLILLHTYLNKITGFALFISVYLLCVVQNINILYGGICILAGISAVEELLIDCKSKEFNPNIKSIFEKSKK